MLDKTWGAALAVAPLLLALGCEQPHFDAYKLKCAELCDAHGGPKEIIWEGNESHASANCFCCEMNRDTDPAGFYVLRHEGWMRSRFVDLDKMRAEWTEDPTLTKAYSWPGCHSDNIEPQFDRQYMDLEPGQTQEYEYMIEIYPIAPEDEASPKDGHEA